MLNTRYPHTGIITFIYCKECLCTCWVGSFSVNNELLSYLFFPKHSATRWLIQSQFNLNRPWEPPYVDGLWQGCCNPIANALELLPASLYKAVDMHAYFVYVPLVETCEVPFCANCIADQPRKCEDCVADYFLSDDGFCLSNVTSESAHNAMCVRVYVCMCVCACGRSVRFGSELISFKISLFCEK